MTQRRPLIALTPGLKEDESYLTVSCRYQEAIIQSGGIPVILPCKADDDTVVQIAQEFDGFIFTGGVDIDPRLFGQDTHANCGQISPMRDAFELPLARYLHDHCPDKPVLGICRGEQVMNVALGGSIIQDIDSEYLQPHTAHKQRQPHHYPSHSVHLSDGTLLKKIVETDILDVNSMHHQAVLTLSSSLCISAIAQDGIIEAFESKNHPFYIGIQWHPECLFDTDIPSKRIFSEFILHARKTHC